MSKGYTFKDEQLEGMLRILNQAAPQKEIALSKGYFFQRRYQIAEIVKKKSQKSHVDSIELNPGQTIELNEGEYLQLEELSPMSAEYIKKDKNQIVFSADKTEFPLIIRMHQSGDRLVINEAGQRKKIARILIDAKIPLAERAKVKVVTTKKNKILWMLPYRQSYLSIENETDKIHYKLTYTKR